MITMIHNIVHMLVVLLLILNFKLYVNYVRKCLADVADVSIKLVFTHVHIFKHDCVFYIIK